MSIDKKKVFKDFIETHDILIVDKNASSRNRLLKIMSDLGAKRFMIHTAGSLQEAQELIENNTIGIVLSDYMISGGSGFDLFKLMREKNPNNKKICQILVTSNISQTAVAKAAEEDVDSFIIKPYTIQSIQENLISTIAAKIQPSAYVLKIEEGKELMQVGKYDESLVILQEALGMHPRPALALFYIGQAEYLKNYVAEAQGSYQKGLSFNNIHYKCLIGLYEIFMKDNKFHEAYQVVKKVARYFPANPDRLAQIVRLAVRTENYQDLQFFYEIFTSLEERNQTLTNYIGAGMYVSGKHSLINNDQETALRYFENIAVSCSEFTKFIRAMITLLVEHNLVDDAARYLARFPAGSNDSEDYLVSDFLIFTKQTTDQNALVRNGLELYNRNIRDFNCLSSLITAMRGCGYKEDRITPFLTEVSALWPDKVAAVL